MRGAGILSWAERGNTGLSNSTDTASVSKFIRSHISAGWQETALSWNHVASQDPLASPRIRKPPRFIQGG